MRCSRVGGGEEVRHVDGVFLGLGRVADRAAGEQPHRPASQGAGVPLGADRRRDRPRGPDPGIDPWGAEVGGVAFPCLNSRPHRVGGRDCPPAVPRAPATTGADPCRGVRTRSPGWAGSGGSGLTDRARIGTALPVLRAGGLGASFAGGVRFSVSFLLVAPPQPGGEHSGGGSDGGSARLDPRRPIHVPSLLDQLWQGTRLP